MSNNTQEKTRDDNLCVDCLKTRTECREDGVAVCASCSNRRYFNDLQNGRRVEIKIKLSDYTQGTVEEIRYVLAKNKIK